MIGDAVLKYAEGREIYHIVLTLRHCDDGISKQVSHLLGSYNKLRKRAFWRKSIVGGFAACEVKVAKDGRRWHPHLHSIVEAHNISESRLAYEWRTATGGSFIVHVRKVERSDKAVKYVCKYASKGWDSSVTASPLHLAAAIDKLRGRRLCWLFGDWRQFRLSDRPQGPSLYVRIADLADVVRNAYAGCPVARQMMQEIRDYSRKGYEPERVEYD